ncbi:hypothetical protein Ctha_0799 [Chloroherpeton thalassium ATCC 35110]|uniref:Uncharacterized protein n=1 Tax=Chloroherpeton thalassium (strain ATCC 35110 / GB-78) TaxID=517418 RepID=B3QWQ3_CHLT3|nr:hypothetical protein [Chloroherpeton thalassium]ACF13267.1 hypothetical protein Ctha_0799 [Chloroherpeton thalassium ATCC 35110]
MKTKLLIAVLWLLSAGFSVVASAQNRQIFVKNSDAIEGAPLTIEVETPGNFIITKTLLFYKTAVSSEFKQVEAIPKGNSYIATIPGKDVMMPSIEYYVRSTLSDNSEVTYPEVSPVQSPVNLTVKPAQQNMDILVISPVPGESVNEEEVLISFSYYSISETVDLSSAKLMVDGYDVTDEAIITENLITYLPESLDPGPHRTVFEISDKDGKLLGSVGTSFSTTTDREGSVFETNPLRVNSDSWVELRNETIADSSVFYGRFNTNLDINYKSVGLRGYMYLTTEEDEDLQPSNRFFLRATTPILDGSLGDIFPDYNYYVANGLRVRGFEVNAHLGPFALDVINGNTARNVDPKLGNDVLTISSSNPDFEDSLTVWKGNGYVVIDSTGGLYTLRYLETAGTYERKLTTVRAGLNSDVFQWDLQYLKSKDQIDGLNYYGTEPQENAVLGMSFRLSPVPNRFELFADGAFSITNTDISSGSISPEDLDSLVQDDISQTIEDNFPGGYSGLTDIITINENLLPLNPLDLSSVAFRAGTVMNFLNNYLRFVYVRQGENYNSFGLSYYQPDIQGFQFFDRLRLFDNKLFLAVNVERMTDNLLNKKDILVYSELGDSSTVSGTTTRKLYKGSISFFPGLNLPNLRFDYSVQNNTNDLPLAYYTLDAQDQLELQSGLLSQIDNQTKTLTFDINQTFNILNGHMLTVGLTTSFTQQDDKRNLSGVDSLITDTRAAIDAYETDQSVDTTYADDLYVVRQKYSSRTISLTSSLTFPSSLRVTFGFTNVFSKYPTQAYGLAAVQNINEMASQTFSSLSSGVSYAFFNQKLRPSARLSWTFGDYERTVLGLSSTYDITPSMYLTGDLSFLFIGASESAGIDSATDVVASVRYQITFGN